MGTVWLCIDETLHRQVAVKQIGSLPGESPGDTARAMREARLTAALNHTNAVSVYDVVEHAGTTWLVMEYMASKTLSQLIASEGSLPPGRVAAIGAQVAAALTSAHSLGIIHRDIKPGNILVGEDDVAKISDFGIARGHTDMRLTQTGMVTGTPAFFSPELARGEEASFASDVWALGITLYTATEGAPPFQPQTNPLAMLSVIANEHVPRPEHAGPLVPVLAGMLDPDPSRRFTMAQALTSLHRVQDQTSSTPSAAASAEAADGAATREEAPTHTPTIESPVEPDYEQPVVLPPAAGRWVEEPAREGDQSARRRSPVGRLVRGALALLVLVGAAALLVNVLGSFSGDNAPTSTGAGGTVSTSGSGTRHHSGTSAGSTSGSASGPASSSGTSTSSSSTTPSTSGAATTSPPASSSGPGGGTSASSPQGFTRLYYRTVPGNLDAGWNMLAPSMQATVGRGSYNGFWHTIQSVSLSSVDALDATTVRYRITYTFFNGTTSTENKQLTLARSGSSYLITSDAEAQ
ncbi:MAG: eukaryotic-like serine/threonine-protein kinase [Nocardioidaceae bacterium]|nr:eukaryotic-like serine/threonine-protein kinase [Nocardioidaceae bacterium]